MVEVVANGKAKDEKETAKQVTQANILLRKLEDQSAKFVTYRGADGALRVRLVPVDRLGLETSAENCRDFCTSEFANEFKKLHRRLEDMQLHKVPKPVETVSFAQM